MSDVEIGKTKALLFKVRRGLRLSVGTSDFKTRSSCVENK
jgi:hypothetical protein